MLMLALYVAGALLLLTAAITLLVGGALMQFIPQLVIGGAFLLIALAIERWRYKPIQDTRPDPRWRDTGERFIDPGSGVLTAVYFDPATAERHYLAVRDGRPTP